MLKVGVSMVRSFGITTTLDYFFNGLFGGISQEQGLSTMNNLCNAITRGDKELFEQTLSNNGTFTASLSFPVGQTYNDIESAWEAVMGTSIEINGDINSAGYFTAVPIYLLLPFTKETHERNNVTQYASSIIRLEFEHVSNQERISMKEYMSSDLIVPTKPQSYLLASVEFFFDF